MERKELKSLGHTQVIEAKNSLQNKALDIARNALRQTGKGLKRRASPNELIQPQTKKKKTLTPAVKREKTQPKKKQSKAAFNNIFG